MTFDEKIQAAYNRRDAWDEKLRDASRRKDQAAAQQASDKLAGLECELAALYELRAEAG